MSEIHSNSSNPSGEKPKRRVRYRGNHPRRYEEKYKEFNSVKYPEELQKVLASGKTPAGMHRPICLDEVLQVLAPKPGEVAVDGTLGYGGHAEEILKRITPGGRLYGLGVDPLELPKTEARLRAVGYSDDLLIVRRMNFAGLPRLLAEEGIEGVDMVLADLGVSSMQIDNPQRGFTFKFDGPLDLRMNPERGEPAAALIARLDADSLAEILIENADEPNALAIAQTITEERKRKAIETTLSLATVVRRALPAALARKEESNLVIRRVFQALRIAVNDEFSALETFLRYLPSCLKPGGRVAVLTFHSGEDRRVKKAFQLGENQGLYSAIAEEVVRPSAEEVRANPRSSSAKLRWAIRAGFES